MSGYLGSSSARAAVLALAAVAVVAGPAAAQAGTFEWDGAMEAGTTLHVNTVHGNVVVNRAGGRTVRVRGQGSPGGDDRLGLRLEARRVDGGVVVCAIPAEGATCDERGIRMEGRSRSRRDRADFTVELPEGVILRVGTGLGDVAVSGATSDVHASSGNGEVRVGAGAARVEASSGNGDVAVDDARSTVRASSGNGSIRVSTASGPVDASTGNGSIQVRMASLRDAGDMQFSSGNGSITLHLPDDFSAELTATTGHGDFSFDFPVEVEGRMSPTRLRGTIGDGSRRLRVATGNGSIHLRKLR